MFIVVILGIFGLAHVYIWKRLIKDTTAEGGVRWILTGVLIVLAGLLVAALLLPRVTPAGDATWIAWPGYLWFAAVGYLLLALLALEPIRLALRGWVKRTPSPAPPVAADEPTRPGTAPRPVNRRVFLARTSAAAAGAASIGLVGVGAVTALGPPDLLHVPVRLRRLDPTFGGFRIAVVSDIHLGALLGRKHTERIVRMVNEAEPDLVAIVGDLADGTVEELGHAAEPLRDLTSHEGTYFVTGNHEYFTSDPDTWLRRLDELGVRTLRNENTAIRRADAAFDLAGINDLTGARNSDPPDFDRALSGLDASRPTVLLSHQPVMVAEAAARGVDLQLSGHTHGGQTWPFGYVVQAVQPALAGLSVVDNTQLYVSRGAGFWGPPVRVGVPPDITVLSLQPDT